jgi:hypothetical protein
LTNQIANPDGEEYREDRLCPNGVLSKLDHVMSPSFRMAQLKAKTAYRTRQPAARNCSSTRLI